MTGFWEEVRAKLEDEQQQQPLPLRAPTIPQAPPAADDSLAGLVERARASMRMAEPAHSVEERFGQAPGADVSQVSRRHAPAAEPEPSLLDLTPQERAMVIRLGTAAGRFDETGTAREAHDRAALVAEATRQGAWTTSEDTTPGRRVNPQGVAGYTAGQNYGR
jgi:hypothetical protein